MDAVVVTYLVYLAIAIGLTVWVATTLSQNGRVFLVDVFGGDEGLADAVNRLLVVGFYLINLGFVSFVLPFDGSLGGVRTAMEELSFKIGQVLIALGVLHFGNLVVFSRIRRRAREAVPAHEGVPIESRPGLPRH